ncbi:unnamed protein product [Lymnaea stagnalis]|uniref:Uncharacterized protein n=1 Tax=Lymnaea stagnalis TaxID=6523 RepID=A0AAV2HR51_LYMST
MQILPGLLSGIALICFIEKSECNDIWRYDSDLVFLDPIDYNLGKKSCIDGYVHGIDHFILTGFINVTGYTLPQIHAHFVLRYLNTRRPFARFYKMWNTFFNLWDERCTDVQEVPLDKCQCKYESAITIRVKCNLTAYDVYSNKPFQLQFQTPSYFYISSNKFMTKVYSSTSCRTGASTNGGMSPHGRNKGTPGHIFLVMALVCSAASMVSNGQ